ncbi:uncharacterized protein V1513DRAFT_455030 [Lipomyces chichibuensis]|uniref:uncharacterized protein n=1 Tax=Lipomyces chichibuensis TaxID=1546026 RepID=UPI0033437A1F
MDALPWAIAGDFLPLLTLGIVFVILLPSGLYRQHMQSSEVFVKRPYNTESLLADALNAKYKVLIDSDSLLSSYSYQPSAYFQSFHMGTPTLRDKRSVGHTSIMLFMAVILHRTFDVIISYFNGDISSPIAAVTLIITIVTVYLGIIMMGSLKDDDACCATVYFNATEKNWVTSSDVALFASSERMEISVKWSVEMLFLVVFGLYSWGRAPLAPLYLEPMIEIFRTKAMPGIEVILVISKTTEIAIFCCMHISLLMKTVKKRRRTVPTIEVQLAQAASDKDVDNADILNFDVGKVIRMFVNDVAKEFPSSCKTWMANTGAYYDFAIAGKHGGLVYGRMRASAMS